MWIVNDVTDHLNSTSTAKIFCWRHSNNLFSVNLNQIYTELINHDSNPNFQAQLDLIHQWSVCWQLPISHSKRNLLCLGRRKTNHGATFTINDIPLATPNFITDLGVIVDPDLKFNVHISEIVVRAKQRAAIIHRCFLSRKVGNLVSAFKTYVRPLLEYASQTWNPYLNYLIEQIESVQRSFTKRLPGFAKLTYAERLIIFFCKFAKSGTSSSAFWSSNVLQYCARMLCSPFWWIFYIFNKSSHTRSLAQINSSFVQIKYP